MPTGRVTESTLSAFWPFTVKTETALFDDFFTVTVIGYTLGAPFAAVTLTERLFKPVRREAAPLIETFAVASVGIATTSTEVVPKGSSTFWSV